MPVIHRKHVFTTEVLDRIGYTVKQLAPLVRFENLYLSEAQSPDKDPLGTDRGAVEGAVFLRTGGE